MADLQTELAARMPWLHARPGTWWRVTGFFTERHTFEDCYARVMPDCGDPFPVFDVMIVDSKRWLASADRITAAVELIMVLANDPLTADDPGEQATIDRAMEVRRG